MSKEKLINIISKYNIEINFKDNIRSDIITEELISMDFSKLSIGDIRDCGKELQLFSENIENEKRDTIYNYAFSLEIALKGEERKRPIEDQFPYLRKDIDWYLELAKRTARNIDILSNENQLTARNIDILSNENQLTARNIDILSNINQVTAINIDKISGDIDKISGDIDKISGDIDNLSRNVNNLTKFQQNKSEELEILIVKGFISWLKTNGYFGILKSPIIGGKIIGRDKKVLVQWDGMVEAYKGGKCYLFMIEVKDTAHINHILKDTKNDQGKNTMEYRCERTKNFFQELKSTDMALTSISFQQQERMFPCYDFELIFVYGSRTIRQDIVKDIKTLSGKINNKIWYCDYNQQCHVNGK
jgi:hypothetical protein